MKIGIPKALLYHDFSKRWKQFFEELGHEVLVSPTTDNEIYSEGIKNSIADLCLPVKVFVGHVLWLKDKVDLVFVPKVKNKEKWEFSCPNIIGTYDLIRNTFSDIKMLTCDYYDDLDSFVEIGEKLGVSRDQVEEVFANLSVRDREDLKISKDKITVAMVGRSYYTEDEKLNLGIKDTLKENDIEVVTSKQLKTYEEPENKMHWTNVNKLMNAIKFFNDNEDIQGLIYIKPFNCGPDFIVEDIMKVNKPMLVLRLDEHCSETGLITRVEAFIDIIKK